MQVEVPDAEDDDDPLWTLLEDTFGTQDTFQMRFKSACKGLAMFEGCKANIEDLQIYLSDFYELVQGFADRGQIDDPDYPDFIVNLVNYFMSNAEPLEMRSKMQEFKVSTFAAAITRFQSYLRPDTISLVNNIRGRNLRARPYDPFAPKDETPRKAAITQDVDTATTDKWNSLRNQARFCDNCTRQDGSSGIHLTKNCPTSPCNICLVLNKPSNHPPKLCSLFKTALPRQGKKATTTSSPVPDEKGARPPWCPPKASSSYGCHRYGDDSSVCWVDDNEDTIPYVESDDDGC